MGILDQLRGSQSMPIGLLEVAANMGTGGLAELGGGLAYLGALPFGGDAAAQYVKQAVQNAYTYQPRSASAQQVQGVIGNLVSPIAEPLSGMNKTVGDATYSATGSPLLAAIATAAPQAAMEFADRANLGALKRAPSKMDITAYHGSPHDFDQFDMSKIGTGEGAQAYSHGLYFAESPDVANEYKNFLGKLEIYHNGNNVGVFDESPSANAAHQIRASGGDVQKAINRAGAIYSGKWRDEVIDSIKKLGPGDVSEKVGGRLYTVDIADDAVANFLDWDKPLREQPRVMAALDEYNKLGSKQIAYSPDMTGQQLHSRMMKATVPELKKNQSLIASIGDQKAVTEIMKFIGIPGVRYLDQGSRQAGKGTSNFVVYDDKLIKILKKE